ncbi:MAG: hypothetical protein WDW36_009261 [Sanguina aurantia]
MSVAREHVPSPAARERSATPPCLATGGADDGLNGPQSQLRPSYNAYIGGQHHGGGNSSYSAQPQQQYGPLSPGSTYTNWSSSMPAELASLGLLPLPLGPMADAHAGVAGGLRAGSGQSHTPCRNFLPAAVLTSQPGRGSGSPLQASHGSRSQAHASLSLEPLPSDPFEQQYSAAGSPVGLSKQAATLGGALQGHTQGYPGGASAQATGLTSMGAHRVEAVSSSGSYSPLAAPRGGTHAMTSATPDRAHPHHTFPPPPTQLAHTGRPAATASSEDARGRGQQQQQHQHDSASHQQQQPATQPTAHTLLLRHPAGTPTLPPQQQPQGHPAVAPVQQHSQLNVQSQQQQQQQVSGGPAPGQIQTGSSSSGAAASQGPPRARSLPQPAPHASFVALQWEYLDAEEVVQGPFESACLVRWFREGHFNSDVLVRAVGFYWTSLGHVITQLESKPPPTAAMHNTGNVTASAATAAAAAACAAAATAGAASHRPVIHTAAAEAPAAAGEAAARVATAGEPFEPQGRTESAVSLFFCDNSPELLWTYLDDSGGVQGGFSSASMMDWFQGGYLRLEVPVMGAILPVEVRDRTTHVKAWYRPLGTLLTYVTDPAVTYKPVRVVSPVTRGPAAGLSVCVARGDVARPGRRYTLPCAAAPCRAPLHPAVRRYTLPCAAAPCCAPLHPAVRRYTLPCAATPCRAPLHPAVRRYTLPCAATPCRAPLHPAVRRYTLPCAATPCRAPLHPAVRRYTLLCAAAPCCALLHPAVRRCTLLCAATPCCAPLHPAVRGSPCGVLRRPGRPSRPHPPVRESSPGPGHSGDRGWEATPPPRVISTHPAHTPSRTAQGLTALSLPPPACPDAYGGRLHQCDGAHM